MVDNMGVNHHVRQNYGSAVGRIAAVACQLAVCLIAIAFIYRCDIFDIHYKIACAIAHIFAELTAEIVLDRRFTAVIL